MQLLGKIIINGNIEALTGIAIGGSDKDIMIGGIDSSVLKNSKGVPFIPGSSLKGKLRSLLELSEGRKKVCDCAESTCDICRIFGVGANKKNDEIGPTRVLIRDAYLNEEVKNMMENKEGIFENLELLYTESKMENTIDRLTSRANPRQLERVPAGAKFDFNIVFDVYEKKDLDRFITFLGTMNMLEDDYIGGHGSRGYGQIQFIDMQIKVKSKNDYITGSLGKLVDENISGIDNVIGEQEILRILEEHLLGDE